MKPTKRAQQVNVEVNHDAYTEKQYAELAQIEGDLANRSLSYEVLARVP